MEISNTLKNLIKEGHDYLDNGLDVSLIMNILKKNVNMSLNLWNMIEEDMIDYYTSYILKK